MQTKSRYMVKLSSPQCLISKGHYSIRQYRSYAFHLILFSTQRPDAWQQITINGPRRFDLCLFAYTSLQVYHNHEQIRKTLMLIIRLSLSSPRKFPLHPVRTLAPHKTHNRCQFFLAQFRFISFFIAIQNVSLHSESSLLMFVL